MPQVVPAGIDIAIRDDAKLAVDDPAGRLTKGWTPAD